MASVNKVILIGNLGKDPEARFFQSGQKYVSFPLATSEHWTDKTTGDHKDKTEWHNITIHNEALVRVAETYLKKGSKVYIEGQLQMRKWTDQSGIERSATNVVLLNFKGAMTLLDPKKESFDDQNQPSVSDYGRSSAETSYSNNQGVSKPHDKMNNNYGLEDDIPF